MPLRVGLTGGIGSGKSIVARMFQCLGVPVYYADEAARRVQETDPQLREQILSHFGPEAYINGKLNRKYISAIVFADPEKLRLLNALVHPVTIRDAAHWLSAQTAPYAIKEAALIFESGSQRDLDIVIGVFAPAQVRIRRVMDRDGISEEEVISRMERQVSDHIKMKLCDLTIQNDGHRLLIPQVLAIHEELTRRALQNAL